MKRGLLWMLGSVFLVAGPVSAQGGQVASSGPTWNKDVAPIVYANCITCHRPGEVAPMSLLSFADARPWARGMKAKVMAHEMPPWFSDPRYGSFLNRRGLTQAQIDTIVAWADAGAPQGAAPEPKAPELGEGGETMNRPPDAIVEMPVEMEIEPTTVMPFFNLWAKAPFTEDKYVEAVELRPSNKAVTHHSRLDSVPLPRGAHHVGVGPAFPGGPLVNAVPVREDGTQLGAGVDDADNEEAIANTAPVPTQNLFMHYAPGTRVLRFKPGLVKVIKRDDFLRFNLHYNATGRVERDRHAALLWFTSGSNLHEVTSNLANAVNLYEGQELIGQGVQRPNIPAYAENYRVSSLLVVSSDTTLNSIWPHMHLRGKDMTYLITYPDGREEIVLSVPKYSFEWQIHYQFNEPVKIPAGSMLRVVAHYDNSAKNKFNPSPDQELPWGAQSWHEMYFPMIDFSIDKNLLPSAKGTN